MTAAGVTARFFVYGFGFGGHMGKMSRVKGARFELEVAKAMTEWLGFQVRRTPRSGAYGQEGWKSLGGDLIFDTPEGKKFPYLVEIKNRESWKLEDLFTGNGPLHEWFAKAEKEAERDGLRPMVIFKRNHVPAFLAVHGGDPLSQELTYKTHLVDVCPWTVFDFGCVMELTFGEKFLEDKAQ